MDTQQVVSNLVGALIFAIPLTARAYYKRANADATVKATIVKKNAELEAQNAALTKQLAEAMRNISMLEKQNDSNNELIAAFSETKTRDDKIIAGLRKDNAELERIVKTGRK